MDAYARRVRTDRAHQELASRRPYWTLYGRLWAGLAAVVVSVGVFVLAVRWVWLHAPWLVVFVSAVSVLLAVLVSRRRASRPRGDWRRDLLETADEWETDESDVA